MLQGECMDLWLRPLLPHGCTGPWAPCSLMTAPRGDAVMHLGDTATGWILRSIPSRVFYASLRTTVIKDETISEGKMDIFPNMEKENLPMKIPLVTGKCLRELCLSLSGSTVIINYKSYYLLAFPRPTKEFRLYVILFLALLHDGEGPLLYCIGRSQAGFMQYPSTFFFLGKKNIYRHKVVF